jgi:peroxiredoxin
MSVHVGDKIPEFKFLTLEDGKVAAKSTHDLFNGKKVVLIAIPGAFTPYLH